MDGTMTTRRLLAHEQLLYDVIQRQAGTLEKAVTELTMNSIEAQSSRVDIKMWEEDLGGTRIAFLSVDDDGIGIRTQEEVVKHFETFGQPHEASEFMIWKQFRMGRGQAFAFGLNEWRTSQFKMIVDVKNRGLDYDLAEGLPEIKGCRIKVSLYDNPIGTWKAASIESFSDKVLEQVRFVSVPVYFNGKQISVDPSTLKWDYEDENAYYAFNDSSSLKVYNLGIYSCAIPIGTAGVGGIVVSKKQLKVNFARNDIQSDCPVFNQIRPVIQENKIKKANKKYRSLGRDERYSLLRDLRDGVQKFEDLKGKRIFRIANGKWYTWNMIMKEALPWSFAPEGDMVADKAMQIGAALCLSDDILDELYYTGPKDLFFEWLMQEQMRHNPDKDDWDQNIPPFYRQGVQICIEETKKTYLRYDRYDDVSTMGLETLRDRFNEDYKLLARKEWTKVEKRIIRALDDSSPNGVWQGRKITMGISTVANAWTDGHSYIALDRNYLRGLNLHRDCDILRLFATMSHELAHDENTAGTHVHGHDFKEKYYEITHDYPVSLNPFYYAFRFSSTMLNANIEMKKEKERQKERELKEKIGLSPAASEK